MNFFLPRAKTLFLAYSFCHFENCLQVCLIYSLVNLSPVTSEQRHKGQKLLSFIYCFITSTFLYPKHAGGTHSDLSYAWIGESETAVGTSPLSWTCLRPPLQPPWRARLPPAQVHHLLGCWHHVELSAWLPCILSGHGSC